LILDVLLMVDPLVMGSFDFSLSTSSTLLERYSRSVMVQWF
jgi:hypothetical protein